MDENTDYKFEAKEKPKVSVIVPVYNSEKFIEKCLTSIMVQTLKELEIVVVNDGSTDSSLVILNSMAQKDSRIKIVSQENQKQGAARNAGTKIAEGEYIGFVDSDDWVDSDYFEKLYNAAQRYDSDIALATNVRIGNGKTKKRLQINEEKFVTNLQNKFDICNLPQNPCPTNKIYRREFLDKFNISWPEGCYCEDKIFVTKCIYYANGVVTVPDVNYYYFRNPNSTVNSKIKKHKKQFIHDKNFARREVLDFLKDNNAQLRDKEFWAIKKDYKLFGKSIYRITESLKTEKHLLFSFIPIWEGEING